MSDYEARHSQDKDDDSAALLPDADPGQTDAEKLSKDEGRSEEDPEP